ncbi:MAG: ABC transporter permease [Chloroflexi bacterium]|nr:ABC transporter permease [Chloroflexota bacterium]
MARFVLRRLGAILLISLAIIFFCALGLQLMRQPFTNTRSSANMLLQAIRDTQSFLRGLFAGNLGMAWRGSGRTRVAVPVTTVVVDTYVKSMGLLLISLLFASVLGIGAGMLAAYWEGSPLSLGVLTTTLLGVSMPTFFTALLLQVIEITWYQRTGVRLVPVGGFGWDAHLILPGLVLAMRPLAQLARITFVSLTEAAHQDYVRTAWAKGLPTRQVWGGHILPNAIVSILTSLGVSLRFSLGSLPVVEYFFSWPGLGATLLNAIRTRQTNLVIALALALGLTFMFINLILELAYRLLDPRLRSEE